MKALILILLLAVAGCTSMEWQKAGSTPEVATRDWGQCLRQAERRVPPDFPVVSSGPVIGPKGEIIGYRAPSPPSHRQIDVISYAQDCMRDNGYEMKQIQK